MSKLNPKLKGLWMRGNYFWVATTKNHYSLRNVLTGFALAARTIELVVVETPTIKTKAPQARATATLSSM